MKRALVFIVCGCAPGMECGSLYRDPVSLPRAGTTEPAYVPLDVAWETDLQIYSGSSPAPMEPTKASATCSPSCKAIVVPGDEHARERLVVVGLAPGPANVELAYWHPAREETMHAKLSLVFTPPEVLSPIAVGAAFVRGPFSFDQVPAELGPALGPARCERDDNRYRCFPLEEIDGEKRYASCEVSWRCSVGKGSEIPSAFHLCLKTSNARIEGITSYMQGVGNTRTVGEWGTGGCKP